ncbi:MAG TPA: tetratricopeptide repeat protein [Candidatus Babeliales bacterium]|nr:tetratricopeptide repeat protein [Candidatus Babeliales bacterium]
MKASKKSNNKLIEQGPLTITWLQTTVPPLLIAACTFIIYFPSLHYDFQFDDIANIPQQFNIRHNTFSDLFFHNTRWISYWLNALYYKIGRFDPFAYRVGNVVLHITNATLIFFILLYGLSHLKRLSFFKTNAFAIALLTSLLFALHPVQTQTVSYVIQGQLEGLATLFILSMCVCLLMLARAKTLLPKIGLTFSLCILAALSCGTKEIAIIAPILLIVFDWFFLTQGDAQALKSRLLLHSAITLIMVSIYLWLLKPAFFAEIFGFQKIAVNNIGNIITHDPKTTITPYVFFISQFKVILHYLWIFIWPLGISVEYDWLVAKNLFAFDCIAPLLILLAIGALLLYLLKKDWANIAVFPLFWFFLCILPRASIIPSTELLADYKTYTASFGWLLLLAAAIIKLSLLAYQRLNLAQFFLITHRQGTIVALLLALPLGWFTIERNKVWHSGLAFWGNILQNAPGKARAYNNYGAALSQHQKFKEAIPYFQKAIDLDPNYPDPYNNIAIAYGVIGSSDHALQALKTCIKINPYYPEGYNNLALFLICNKEYTQAEHALHKALKLRPYYGKAYINLGRIYLEQNKIEKAWVYFKKACMQADLDTEDGFSLYAKTSLALNKFDDAISGFKKTLEFNPKNPDTLFNLGNAYYLHGQQDAAIVIYKQLVIIEPHQMRGWFNLAEAYFSRKETTKALDCFLKAASQKKDLPQLYLRIARCYEQLNQPLQARKELIDLLKLPQLPEKIKITATQTLAQLERESN